MNLKEQIEEYLQKNKFEIVSRTCDLVKIPSINVEDHSGKPYGIECAKAIDFCDQLCKEKHLVTKNYDYRCLEVMCREDQTGKRLLIATHADVVPTVDDNIYDPFAGKVYGDYIVGRGVVDDKGPLIASLYALAFFKEYGIPLKNDIRLVFGSNEECGMDDLQYYLERAGQPDWGLAVDDDFPTVNGEKGLVHFSISAPKAEHVESINSYGSKQRLVHDYCESTINGENMVIGRTEKVANPVLHRFTGEERLFKNDQDEKYIREILADIDGHCLGINHSDEMSGKTSVKVFKAESDAQNITLTFDIRTPVTLNIDDVVEKLIAYGKKTGLEVKIVKVSKGYYQKPENEIVSMLTELYNKEFNANEKPYVMGACTYARLFDNGCGFGGGNPHEVKPFPKGHGAAHGADEAHNIYVLFDAIKMLILGIKAIDDKWS